jgi:hypothetical protein
MDKPTHKATITFKSGRTLSFDTAEPEKIIFETINNKTGFVVFDYYRVLLCPDEIESIVCNEIK